MIRAGLRLLEEEENKVIALKRAIEEGFESGIAKNFNSEKHLAKLKAAKRKNGYVYPYQIRLLMICQKSGIQAVRQVSGAIVELQITRDF